MINRLSNLLVSFYQLISTLKLSHGDRRRLEHQILPHPPLRRKLYSTIVNTSFLLEDFLKYPKNKILYQIELLNDKLIPIAIEKLPLPPVEFLFV